MHISIDTSEPITDLDRSILAMLTGGTLIVAEEVAPNAAPPAKKAAAKTREATNRGGVTVKEPEPEVAPEPMAEEPLEEEPEVEEDLEDEASDEDLLALAVKKATEMVAAGDAAGVREALDAAGANRVRELNKDNVREFFKALG